MSGWRGGLGGRSGQLAKAQIAGGPGEMRTDDGGGRHPPEFFPGGFAAVAPVEQDGIQRDVGGVHAGARMREKRVGLGAGMACKAAGGHLVVGDGESGGDHGEEGELFVEDAVCARFGHWNDRGRKHGLYRHSGVMRHGTQRQSRGERQQVGSGRIDGRRFRSVGEQGREKHGKGREVAEAHSEFSR